MVKSSSFLYNPLVTTGQATKVFSHFMPRRGTFITSPQKNLKKQNLTCYYVSLTCYILFFLVFFVLELES